MGQKVHPHGLRLGIIRDWDGRWYAGKREYAELLHEDLKIRRFVKKRFYSAGVSRIEIERAANQVRITIHTARPGMVIGKGGQKLMPYGTSWKLYRKTGTGEHCRSEIS